MIAQVKPPLALLMDSGKDRDTRYFCNNLTLVPFSHPAVLLAPRKASVTTTTTTTTIIIIIIIIVITVDDSNEPCKTGGKLEGQVNRSMHLLTL